METLKENDKVRVRIVSDDSGEKPYDEGSVPILARDFGYRMQWEAFNEQAEEYADKVTEVYRRLNGDEDAIERYLRIFHGAYSVAWDSSQNGRYLAFDTAAWRESVGLTDEFLESGTDSETFDRSKIADGSLSEVMAWANGEVYGYVVEKLERFRRVYVNADGVELPSQEVAPIEEEWQEVDSCYGFYGYDAVKEAAEQAFDNINANV